MRCIRCKRPLKNAPHEGMGPTCFAKAGKQSEPRPDFDLWGFNPDAAAENARDRLEGHIAFLVDSALGHLHREFTQARVRLGIAP